MVRAMMVDKITHDVPETSSCRRKSSGKKGGGNLRRKRIRMIGKEMWEEMVKQEKDDSENGKKHSHSNEWEVGKYGRISVIGRRREMEDAVAVEVDFVRKGEKSYDFYGVYDGHGGRSVAEACSEMMHKVLVEMISEEEGVCWEKVMVEGFRKMDDQVNKKEGAMTGSTAVVAVVGEDDLVVANCGDSRAVMRRAGAAVPLSDHHKPNRPDELGRIQDSGGKVINWNGQRVLGVLATSRSVGDYYLKPEVKVIKRTESDEFIILASDGLWDVISNDLACQVTRRCLDGHITRRDDITNNASEAAAVLAELAIARGSRHNISVVVVDLKRDSFAGNGTSSCR